jgi:hypothetical protein
MNDAMRVSMTRIKSQIPNQILEIAFRKKDAGPFANLSIDEQILDEVVRERVMTDCNLMGGRTTQISLAVSMWEQTVDTHSQINSGTGPFSIYRIPADRRENCDILEIHHTHYPMPYGNGVATNRIATGGTMCAHSKNLLNSHTAGDTIQTPTAELLQGNVIRLHPGSFAHIDWVVTCRLAYDENMTNLNSSAINSFAKLCILAVKQHIYNNLIINLDAGFIQGGAEITNFRTIIEQWSDLNPEYLEELDVYFGANFMDIQRIGPLLKYMI